MIAVCEQLLTETVHFWDAIHHETDFKKAFLKLVDGTPGTSPLKGDVCSKSTAAAFSSQVFLIRYASFVAFEKELVKPGRGGLTKDMLLKALDRGFGITMNSNASKPDVVATLEHAKGHPWQYEFKRRAR